MANITNEQAHFLQVCEQNASLILQALNLQTSECQQIALSLEENGSGVFTDSARTWKNLADKIEDAYNNLPEE